MSRVQFYILSESENTDSNGISPHFAHACSLAAFYYSQNKKVFIYTDDQEDAFSVDEYLWQFDGDSFVPHNLFGEGPSYGSPVEISWHDPIHPCPVLINLSLHIPAFSNNFQQIIDFVPADDDLKVQARKRYTAYKKLGHTLSTSNVETQNTTNNKVEE